MKMLVMLLLLLASSAVASTIYVPADQITIQAAIDASSNGDTVLVSPGRYYENIIYRGKSVIVASQFIISGDPDDILNTIIDGSHFSDPDSASTVAMYHNESVLSTALIGFVITGGHGCIVFGAKEGGGINIDNASATIRNNIIVGNEAYDGGNLKGGGGVNFRFSNNSRLYGNIIMHNRGRNYCGGLLVQEATILAKNNIISYNDGGNLTGTWDGAGGVYTYKNVPASTFENNIISNNYAAHVGGFFANVNGSSILINNIIRDNSNDQILLNNTNSAAFPVLYSNVEGGWSGSTNMDIDPEFDALFRLNITSPMIDAGNPDVQYNDYEDPLNPGLALTPSLGTTTNDIGAYGGPNPMPVLPLINLVDPILEFAIDRDTTYEELVELLPLDLSLLVNNSGLNYGHIDSLTNSSADASVSLISTDQILILGEEMLQIEWTPASMDTIYDTIAIHHDDPNLESPVMYVVNYLAYSGCCGLFTSGFSGNADCSIDGKRNLADITLLIDHVYISQLPLCCEENGNSDGDLLGKVNLSDITRLIDHVYISQAETEACI